MWSQCFIICSTPKNGWWIRRIAKTCQNYGSIAGYDTRIDCTRRSSAQEKDDAMARSNTFHFCCFRMGRSQVLPHKFWLFKLAQVRKKLKARLGGAEIRGSCGLDLHQLSESDSPTTELGLIVGQLHFLWTKKGSPRLHPDASTKLRDRQWQNHFCGVLFFLLCVGGNVESFRAVNQFWEYKFFTSNCFVQQNWGLIQHTLACWKQWEHRWETTGNRLECCHRKNVEMANKPMGKQDNIGTIVWQFQRLNPLHLRLMVNTSYLGVKFRLLVDITMTVAT